MDVPTLSPTQLDLKEIFSLGDDFVDFEKDLRDELRVFYSRDELDSVIDEIISKEEDHERTVKETKSDTELFELMTHREEVMRSRALLIIFNKIRGAGVAKSQQQDMIEKLRANPLSLIHCLDTKDLKELHKVIILLITVMDEEFKLEFQKKGGFTNLCKALSLPALAHSTDVLTHLLVTVITFVTAEQNRGPFREAGGLIRLVPYLSHSDTKIKLMATESLLNLTLGQELNQSVVTRTGVLPTVLSNALDSTDHQTKYENLFLFLNLSRCEAAKKTCPRECLLRLLPLLDPQKAYEGDKTMEGKNNFQIQRTLLDIFYEMSKTTENQDFLGQNNLLLTMQSFFLPLKANSPYKWNFDVLLLVLRIIDNLLKSEANRKQFLDAKGIVLIDQIIVNHQSYPEECLMDAASILTTISTKAEGVYGQQYGKLGLQRLIGLLQQFPKRDFVHHLVANMISSVATNPNNRQLIVQNKGDRILMSFIKDSRVKQVLIKACLGLAELCGEVRIVRSIVSDKVVPHLVSLLQLNQPELQLPVVKILRAVAEESESGLIEIVRNRGIVLLVALLADKSDMSWEVKLQALATIHKILTQPGQAGPQNITMFFQAEGEQALLTQCLVSPSESVHKIALEIILFLLKKGPENRAHLMNAGLGQHLHKCMTEMITAGSSSEFIANQIQGILEKDPDHVPISTGGAAVAGKRVRALWLKVVMGEVGKLFPLRDSLKFPEFADAIRGEFGIREWDRLSLRHGADEIEVNDQRCLNYILFCLQNEIPIQVEILPKTTAAARGNKLDVLLQRLTHRQLRILVKEAIDQQIDMAGDIRQFVILELKRQQSVQVERVNGDPIGEGEDDDKVSSPTPIAAFDPSQPPPLATGGPPLPKMGGPPPPGLPPPPDLSVKKGFMPGKKKAGGGKAGGGGDLMSQLKSAVALGGGGLKRVNLSDQDRKALLGNDAPTRPGGASVRFIAEEAEAGQRLWERDQQSFVNALQKVLTVDYGMMYCIFKILRKTFSNFNDLYEMLFGKLTKEEFARALLDIGFTLSYTLFVVSTGDDTENRQESLPQREYSAAIAPYNIPVGVAYKTIAAFMKANRRVRIGGPIDKDVKELKEARIQNKKAAEADVVSWGGGGGARPGQIGKLWDDGDDEPVVSGWTKTEKPKVGKLW